MTGKIAVFIGQVNQEYQEEMTRAIVEAAENLGYQLDVFSEFGSYGNNYLHAEGERNIINLPFLEDYDGVIVAPDTFGVREMEKQLDILLLSKVMGPIVSIRQEKNCFFSVQIDNRAAMARMVEHFVKKHGFKRICFMKGRDDLKDAQERYQGYLDIMEKYQLPVTEHMIFNGNYWRDMAVPAVDWFLSGEEMPEAIVCANDFMAGSVLAELKERGIRVPEDIALSGFDDIEESRYSEPGLSSVRMPCEEIGYEAVRIIDCVCHGGKSEQIVRLPVKISYRGSCGCGKDERGHWTSTLYQQKLYLNHVITQNGFMNNAFDNCDTMEDLLTAAYQFTVNFKYKRIFLCLCETVDENGERIAVTEKYTDKMVLRAVMESAKGVEIKEQRFLRRELLPEEYMEGILSRLFFLLHHRNHCLGYLVVEARDVDELKAFFNCWVMEVGSCVDKILLYEENKNLQEFRKLSMVDDLTGLFNRRKLEQELSKKMILLRTVPVYFFIVSLDMDGLKKINDTYGHLEGDVALKAYANILQKNAEGKNMAFRVGGDELTMLIETQQEEEVKRILKRVDEDLATFNANSQKPYELSGSAGYAQYSPKDELTNCIKRADINMYANKMARKKSRVS